MASIFKKESTGKWGYRISHTFPNGIRKQFSKMTFRTKKEAELAAKQVELELENNGVSEANTMIFADYFEQWVNDNRVKNVSRSTISKYESEVKRVHEFFGKTLLSDITRPMIQSFLDDRGKGNGKDIVEKTKSRISGCLKLAIADGLIATDPTHNLKLNYEKESKSQKQAFSEKEVIKLMAHLADEINPSNVMIYIALSTGMRIGEVFALKWEDVQDDKITINKGFDYHWKAFTNAKNQYSHRVIKISEDCKAVISQYKMIMQKKLPEYMFLHRGKEPIISHNTLGRYFKDTCNQLGLPEYTLHTLRHTHASILIHHKMNIAYISRRLGHKNILETLKTYSHMIDEVEQLGNEQMVDVMNNLHQKSNHLN